MAAIRIVQKPVNGVISFPVPDDMRDNYILIEFRPDREGEKKTLAEVADQLFNKLPKPNPDFDWDSLNVYEQ